MDNRKKYYLIALICVITVLAVIGISVSGRKAGEIDELAVSRSQEEEGETHYIDDGAIAAAEETVTAGTPAQAAAMLEQVNQIRANAGLSALEWSDGLAAAAQVRAQECEQVFSHVRPNGTDWWTVNSPLMYGENLAANYSDSSSVCAAWMASPTHSANILGGFRTMGAAVHRTSGGVWYWAQEFGY